MLNFVNIKKYLRNSYYIFEIKLILNVVYYYTAKSKMTVFNEISIEKVPIEISLKTVILIKNL